MKNKEKYDLRKLEFVLAPVNGKRGYVIKYEGERVGKIVPNSEKSFPDWAGWLESEYVPQILDEQEKKYLSAFIKPWKNKIKYIKKVRDVFDSECILIWILNERNIYLPRFKREKMYTGMKANKEYTLKELGL